jgi:hypothetical protein
VVAVSAFIGWWVFRTSMVNEFARARPPIAAMFAPEDPRVVSGMVNLDLRRRMGAAGDKSKSSAREAVVKAPLMEEPFLLGGVDRLMRRDSQAAKQFIQHALRRNPRSRLARLFMLELELRAGNARQAAADMTILSRLMPDVQRIFVPELARFATNPDTNSALAEALRSDPFILKAVLHHLATKDAPVPIILRLAGDNPPAVTEDDTGDWRRSLLESLVRRGDFAKARALWAQFSGIDPKAAAPLVYDGQFRGLPGLAPFNWTFSSSEDGAAERERSGALQVEYYGRRATDLATQLMTLVPGRYRFAFHAEGDLSTPQNRLIWVAQCQKGNATIMELPITNVTFAGRTVAGDFSVPADCPAQWLKLVGRPTEFPKIEAVLIRNVRMQALGGAR